LDVSIFVFTRTILYNHHQIDSKSISNSSTNWFPSTLQWIALNKATEIRSAVGKHRSPSLENINSQLRSDLTHSTQTPSVENVPILRCVTVRRGGSGIVCIIYIYIYVQCVRITYIYIYKCACAHYIFSSFRVVADVPAAADTTKFGRLVVLSSVIYLYRRHCVCVCVCTSYYIIYYIYLPSHWPLHRPLTTLGKTPSPAPAVTYIGTHAINPFYYYRI